jgi:hypothetical protein
VGASSFTLKNVHVKNAKVSNQGYVTEDGGAILLGTVSRPVGAESPFGFGNGKTVIVEDCSVTAAVIGGEVRSRVAAVVGHVWGGFDYKISKVTVTDFESNASSSGILLGEAEGSAVSLNHVGIFGCCGGDSAVAALGEGATVTAADLLVSESGALTEGIPYSDSFADVAAEGVTVLESAAFRNGEAAWKANDADGVWLVGKTAGYPTLTEGGVPHRVGFDGVYCYTNANGMLLLSEEQLAELSAKSWFYGEDRTAWETLVGPYTADLELYSGDPRDLDGDGSVTTADVVLLMQHLVGYDVTFRQNADLNADGRVSIYDAVLLLRELSK